MGAPDLGLVLVEHSVAKGAFIDGCFCLLNGGYKIQMHKPLNKFLAVN